MELNNPTLHHHLLRSPVMAGTARSGSCLAHPSDSDDAYRDFMMVRRIRSDEGGRLKEVRLKALTDSPTAFGSSYSTSAERPDAHWIEWADRASAGATECLFVAESDRELVGLIGAFTVRDRPEDRHLIATWVDPRHRRGGIGRELTRAAIAWCRESGAHRVGLWVVEGNDAARRLYEKEGFVAEGRSQPLPSHPDLTEHLMMLELG